MNDLKKTIDALDQVITGEKFRFSLISNNIIRMEYSSSGILDYNFNLIQKSKKLSAIEYTTSTDNGVLKIDTKNYTISYFIDKIFSYNNLSILIKQSKKLYRFGVVDSTNLKGLEFKEEHFEKIIDNGLFSRDGYALYNNSKNHLLKDGILISNDQTYLDFYFFIFQDNYLDSLKTFYAISQKPKLLPKYLFGNIWHFNYKNLEDLKEIINKFNDFNLPISLVINNIYVKTSTNEKIDFLDWQNFLSEKEIAFMVNVYPITNGSSLVNNQELLNYFESNSNVPYNIDNKYFESNFNNQDALNFISLFNKKHSNSRQFTLQYYQELGSHIYPVALSPVDLVSWDSLEKELMLNITSSLVGVSYLSHDIGGYYEGIEDDELYIRWLQLGVVSVIMKINSYGNEFPIRIPFLRQNLELSEIFKKYLTFRTEIASYLYTMSHKYVAEGVPIIRPLYFYTQVNNAYLYNNYYFGDDLIAAPVTCKCLSIAKYSKVKVYLPKGLWYNFFTGQEYRGGRVLAFYPQLDELLLFARSGAIIPLTNIADSNEIRFIIFKGKKGTFSLYEDDNYPSNYLNGDSANTIVEMRRSKNKITIKVKLVGNSNLFNKNRVYSFEFKNLEMVDKVNFSNASVITEQYNSIENKYIIKVTAKKEEFKFTVTYQESSEKNWIKNNLFQILLKSNIDNVIKNAIIYQLFNEEKSKKEMIGIAKKLKINKFIKSTIINIIKQ